VDPTEDIRSVRAVHGDSVVVYDDADHGFMRDGSDSYHPVHGPDPGLARSRSSGST